MSNISINQSNIDLIKWELDKALSDVEGAPFYLIVEAVMSTLDSAERDGRLNSAERRVAWNYIRSNYGYDF